ncbi:MAG TPA: DUF2085 domain-containing protein [Acidobacteriota bacterium]|nr:DUF2085 domain-containing protein [Acidobacteriota bacterium]
MRKLQSWLILGTTLWCAAILLPALASADWIRLFFAAICHQMPSRSFWLFGKPLAVCVRCSGFYFGFLFALILESFLPISGRSNPAETRRGEFQSAIRNPQSAIGSPRRQKVLRAAAALVLIDVANSFVLFYPDLPWFRFTSAFLFSIVVAPFIVKGLYQAIQSIRNREVKYS